MKKPVFRFNQRACGILLHPTSLPGRHGSGDLGRAAYEFVDFLAAAGQRWWQMLPITPPGKGNSPYSPYSAFAGNPALISLDTLTDEGLLTRDEVKPPGGFRDDRVKFDIVNRFRQAGLRQAFERFVAKGGMRRKAVQRFREQQHDWLDDYVLFSAIKRANSGKPWLKWPRGLRSRRKTDLKAVREELADEIEFEVFLQYEFERQWTALRKYAHAHGVGLIGDIPIFVSHDSSDVWANPKLFQLDAAGRPKVISGVPPDSFSRNGQLWEHPHYAWPAHKRTGFAWWTARFKRLVAQFDGSRIDHFLGFHRCWAVPGRAKTARKGKWILTPGRELFDAVKRSLGHFEIIAEDLGFVTAEAVALRDRLGYPGMRLMQCGFGDDEGCRFNQPHSYPRACVAYTGTHDNETTVGWAKRLKAESRRRRNKGEISEYERLLRYTGGDGKDLHWELMRLGYYSSADTVIYPAQDILGLDDRARMNVPAVAFGNWEWRMRPRSLTTAIAKRLRAMAQAYDRIRD